MFLSHLKETVTTILEKDPAARSALEVVLCYPGFHALTMHRLSHRLWQLKLYTLARFLSHWSRIFTGIEIHPGATIGRRVFIDHGLGVVIGETTIVGDDVVIYQGVTLGAGSAARMGALSRDTKRHPTLGNGVVVGSGAEIQGNITVGDNVRVASGSIVLKDVPRNCVVVGVPGRVIFRDGEKVKDDVPDIEAEAIKSLKERLRKMESQIATLLGDSTLTSQVEQEDRATSPPGDEEDPVDVFLHGAGI